MIEGSVSDENDDIFKLQEKSKFINEVEAVWENVYYPHYVHLKRFNCFIYLKDEFRMKFRRPLYQ